MAQKKPTLLLLLFAGVGQGLQSDPCDADGEDRVQEDLWVLRVPHSCHDLCGCFHVPADKPGCHQAWWQCHHYLRSLLVGWLYALWQLHLKLARGAVHSVQDVLHPDDGRRQSLLLPPHHRIADGAGWLLWVVGLHVSPPRLYNPFSHPEYLLGHGTIVHFLHHRSVWSRQLHHHYDHAARIRHSPLMPHLWPSCHHHRGARHSDRVRCALYTHLRIAEEKSPESWTTKHCPYLNGCEGRDLFGFCTLATGSCGG